ncbi:MAG: hypothetical protein KF708_22895 [Pirellulales bacterium]|nr:hypothetical protein [Pirellulales bacterium]
MLNPEHTQDRAEAKETEREHAAPATTPARGAGLGASFGSASAAVARRGFAFGRTAWRKTDGVLSFEWILLVTLVVVGIVGGLSAARDAVISELGDIAGAIIAVDQSYTGFCSSYDDTPVTYTSCRPDVATGT